MDWEYFQLTGLAGGKLPYTVLPMQLITDLQ